MMDMIEKIFFSEYMISLYVILIGSLKTYTIVSDWVYFGPK